MKVLLINGSPHKNGCTNAALTPVAGALQEDGIETEIFWIGTKPVRGCLGCGKCSELGKCAFDDDVCNQIVAKLDEIDGIVLGSPVFWAGPNGALKAVLDRVFMCGGKKLAGKAGAAVASARRAGTTATLDVLNKYFTFFHMPQAGSCYWPMVHGRNNTPEDVEQDIEGVAIMQQLGHSMAYMIKAQAAAKEAGVEPTLIAKPQYNYVH